MKDFIRSIDAVGSLYFDFETQKTIGLIATLSKLDKDTELKIEEVCPKIDFKNYKQVD